MSLLRELRRRLEISGALLLLALVVLVDPALARKAMIEAMVDPDWRDGPAGRPSGGRP